MNQPKDNSGIGQNAENSHVEGMQGIQGEKNVQVQGDGNLFTFNQTEILQISEKEITIRELNITSPYRGLKTFESKHKELFFGRDNFIRTLVNELEQANLILLLGASGSGKSSVVRAGLIPWLERKYGNEFVDLIFTPDADPFESFYISLGGKYSQSEAKIAREVQTDTLVRVVNNLKKDDKFWFIFIDQFEELFTISDENKRREFIDGLMKLSRAKLPNLKIMATMRADFFERLSDFPQLVEVTQKHRPMIVEMQSSELRLAIEQPAAHHGIIFEAGLVDKIIAEVQGQAGYLPLLQYTLNLLWKDEVKTGSINKRNRTLKISTYQNLGGVQGALQKHVNYIYEERLPLPEEKLAAQRIFLKLVDIGENAESGIEWKPVRRRAMLSEFNNDERDVLLKLVNENLLVSDADLSANSSKKARKSGKSNSTIEIAHEILLTSWDKLHNWIEKNRQGIAIRNRLYEDVKRWQVKKPEDELWIGSKLEQVLELRNDDNFNQVLGGFNDDANQFIDASLGVRDRQLKKARRNTRIGFTLAGLASIASVFALIQQQQTQKEVIINMTQTAQSRLQEGKKFDAMKQAIKAYKELNNLWMGDAKTRTQVELALLDTVHNFALPNTLGEHADDVNGVSFSPDGKMLASASDDNTVILWDIDTGKLIKTLTGHTKSVNSVSFSPSGKMLATASTDNTVIVWDTGTGEAKETLTGHKKSIKNVSFSPDGKMLATASKDKTVKLWDTTTGKVIKNLSKHTNWVRSVSFSSSGKMLASVSDDRTVRLWDTSTGKEIKTLRGISSLRGVSFSPSDKMLASASTDNTVKLWDTSTGKEIKILSRHRGDVYGVSFSPSGKMLASASADNTVKLWDTSTGKEIKILSRHRGDVYGVSFSPSGKMLASASADNTVKLWDTSTGKEIKTLSSSHTNRIWDVSFSPSSKMLASASADNTIKLWDTSTGKEIKTLRGHKSRVKGVSFSPSGKMLASASGDNTIKLWDTSTGKEIKTLSGHKNSVLAVNFVPSEGSANRTISVASSKGVSKILASASADNTVKLWDTSTGKEIKTLSGHKNSVWDASFSPDGKMLATASEDKTVKLWDTSTGEEIKTLSGHKIWVWEVNFSPSGKMLASTSGDNTIKLWNTDTGEEIKTLSGHTNSVADVSFSPNGKMLATASEDNTVKIWDISTGEEIKTLSSHIDWVWAVSFSPNGKMLATASNDKTVRLWRWDADYLLKEGCDFMRQYWKYNRLEDESEKKMCDGVR